MPRFKTTKDILKIVENKDQIRNIGIIAHVDHGKCVSGDSYVSLTDGDILTIREIYEKLGSGEIIEIRDQNVWVDSLNVRKLEVEDRKATHICKLKSDQLVKIRLKNGYSVTTTPEHPFYVINNVGLVEARRARNLREGDYVAVPATQRFEPLKIGQVKTTIFSTLAEKGGYLAYLNEEFQTKLSKIIHKMGVKKLHRKLNSKIKYRGFLGGVNQGRFRFEELEKIGKIFGISFEAIYDNIETLAFRKSTKKAGKTSKYIRLPKTPHQFLSAVYVAGALFGDGSEKLVLNNSSPVLLTNYVTRLSEAFGVTYNIIETKTTKKVIQHGGLTLTQFFKDVLCYPPKKKSYNLKLPPILLKMEKPYTSCFLQGLFDTDGTVEQKRSAVSLTTASIQFAKRLAILLPRFGIIPTLNLRKEDKYADIYISGEYVKQFSKEIGFTIPEKKEKLLSLEKKAQTNRSTCYVPISPEELRKMRIMMGLGRCIPEIPYFQKIESNKQKITRNIMKKVVSIFEDRLSNGSLPYRKILILDSLLNENLNKAELAKKRTNLSISRLNGIMSGLKKDNLCIENPDKTYKITPFGKQILRIWKKIQKGRGNLTNNLNSLLEFWRRVIEGNVRFIKVTEKNTQKGDFDVYDLTVPGTETFIANGIVVHNTTLTDSLLAAAGLLSPTMAGQALALDYLEEEQERQMTIKAANISLYYEREGVPYLVNLIDTPGHVDFSGRVTRSLRAIDGTVVVVDAVEGVMVQTETVTRQACEERVRPVLFINKIDRLIKELRLSPDLIQERMGRIISDFNGLIDTYAEPEFREKWKVSPQGETIAFGSAKDRWGLTLQIAQKKSILFKDIVNAYKNNQVKDLVEVAPLHKSVLDMVINNMPPPHIAQKYRIPKIWRGNLESEIGQAMIECDESGPAVMCVTNINVDPQAGLVATGRLFSGVVSGGDSIYLINTKTPSRIQQVCIYMGPYREIVGTLPSGNIPALLGLSKARAGETISSLRDTVPFEAVQYVTEPVMTMAVEPKSSQDLPKLVDFLRKLSIEDPTLVTKIDEETGEYLLSGMGQLHLEIATTWIRKTGIKIITSEPTVIYRESIKGSGGPYESKSPNKHNKVFIAVEALKPEVLELVKKGVVSEGLDRKKMASILRDHGWETKEARGVWAMDPHGNIFTNISKGVQRLDQVKGSITIGFVDAMDEGPLAGEPVRGVKVKLVDASIHEDPVHFGPAQMIPATRHGIFAAMLSADPILLEPLLKINVKAPMEEVGSVTSIVSQKRGKILSVEQRDRLAYITGELPASETFDISDVMRSATGGKAFWGTEFSRWETVSQSMKTQLIQELRRKKGLSPSPPTIKQLLKP